MKRLFLLAIFAAAAFGQSATVSGASGQITGTLAIPLAPSTLTFACTPMLLQKGVPINCMATLDVPVPEGQSFLVTLTVTAPAGITVVATPITFTIPAGTSKCGSTTTPCFTLTRQ